MRAARHNLLARRRVGLFQQHSPPPITPLATSHSPDTPSRSRRARRPSGATQTLSRRGLREQYPYGLVLTEHAAVAPASLGICNRAFAEMVVGHVDDGGLDHPVAAASPPAFTNLALPKRRFEWTRRGSGHIILLHARPEGGFHDETYPATGSVDVHSSGGFLFWECRPWFVFWHCPANRLRRRWPLAR